MGRTRDRSERLDPVRWRAPGRGALLRLAVIAVLLAVAAGVIRLRPAATPCTTSAAPATSTSTSGIGTARASGTASAAPQESGNPSIPAGTVGVPVRLADPTALALVHPGNVVDLLRLGEAGESSPIASSALVLDVTGADDPATGGLLLALDPEQAGRAVGGSSHGFAILIRPG
ncbi:hypothetical protein [Actinoplanes sp. NPDC020271]|uniref:hypothetical protein n=1 Tax=Actinoplanes sp. NPDC020271 TaxID=3363896 RepID=UPI0037A173A6